MRQRYPLLLMMLLTLVLVACSGTTPEAAPWLLGRWQVSYNPNNDDNDVMVFQPDAMVTIETEDGRTLPGQYQIKQDQLLLLIQVGQRNVETGFTISAARDRLVYKNGAYYTKVNDGGGSSR